MRIGCEFVAGSFRETESFPLTSDVSSLLRLWPPSPMTCAADASAGVYKKEEERSLWAVAEAEMFSFLRRGFSPSGRAAKNKLSAEEESLLRRRAQKLHSFALLPSSHLILSSFQSASASFHGRLIKVGKQEEEEEPRSPPLALRVMGQPTNMSSSNGIQQSNATVVQQVRRTSHRSRPP